VPIPWVSVFAVADELDGGSRVTNVVAAVVVAALVVAERVVDAD
jgi:hypothetical protein